MRLEKIYGGIRLYIPYSGCWMQFTGRDTSYQRLTLRIQPLPFRLRWLGSLLPLKPPRQLSLKWPNPPWLPW